MGTFKGLPEAAVSIFTPTVVFSTTQGTVTYQQQYGAVRILSGDRIIGANAPTGSFLCIVSTSLIFTFAGSVGNVSVSGFPFSLPTSINGARQAVLSMTNGITPPANAKGSPKSSFTYPSTNPASCNLIYSSNTGSDVNIDATNLTEGGTTIGITQAISAIITPSVLQQNPIITVQSRSMPKKETGEMVSLHGTVEQLVADGHISIEEIIAFI